MKINKGNIADVSSALVFSNGDETLVLRDRTNIRVITDNTDFDHVIEGEFRFVDDDTLEINGESIHIDYIEEIILLEDEL